MSINKTLQKKILSMVKVDQGARKWQHVRIKFLRKRFSAKERESSSYKKEIKKMVKGMSVVDRKNTTAMKKIIAKYGWPIKSLVGVKGSHAAWLLVQHSTHDIDFQKYCLILLKKAAKENEVDIKNIAYLTDRILVLENRRQIFGTQFKGSKEGHYSPFPIKDEKNLDKRRGKIGLEPFNIYFKKMKALE